MPAWRFACVSGYSNIPVESFIVSPFQKDSLLPLAERANRTAFARTVVFAIEVRTDLAYLPLVLLCA